MLSEYRLLLKDYIDAYWDIKNDAEAIPADQRDAMQQKLKEYFLRDCAVLEGNDGLKAERERAKYENELKEIEEQKKFKNAEIDAAYRLKHAEANKKAEIQSAQIAQSIELEKAKIDADTEIQKSIIEKDIEIRKAVEEGVADAKAARVIPVRKHHRGFFRWHPNEAYVLAEKKSKLESMQYLADYKDELIKMQAKLTGSDELEFAICNVFNEYVGTKRGREAKAAAAALTEIVQPLCAVLARREHAFEDMIAQLSALGKQNDEEGNGSEAEEPEDSPALETSEKLPESVEQEAKEMPAVSDEEAERQRLQKRAAELIIALCNKRIEEAQQAQINKPKRVRKKPAQSEIDKTKEGEGN